MPGGAFSVSLLLSVHGSRWTLGGGTTAVYASEFFLWGAIANEEQL